MSYKLNPENYGKPLIVSMFEFKPDYSKCIDDRKELYHNLCKNLRKHDVMICTINNKPCKAWEGYEHTD
jgi:hypothetical protein